MRSPSASCLTVCACSRTFPAGRLATPSSSVSAHSMSFLPRLEFRVVFNHGEESLPAASHLFLAQRSIAHTCVLALATCLQSRFLHVIPLVYAHLLTWKVGSVRSTHCYFLMVLLSCRKLGKRVAFPGNLRRNDSGILQSPEPHPSCPSTAFTSADGASGPFGTVIVNEVFSSGVLLSEYAALDGSS